jgi:hypothetical protein
MYMARAAGAGFGEDFFAGGHLAQLTKWFRETIGEEKVSVEVTLYSGGSFYITDMLAKHGHLMFILEGEPHEAVFVPVGNVAKVHVTKLRTQSGHVGFAAQPMADPPAS